jgi:phenylacetate-coenzyme A ligase PaaK-like adenylate-forming protein
MTDMFTIEPAQLAALRTARLAATLDRVCAAHPYYRALFAKRGLQRGDFRDPDDLRRIPVTLKRDYIADPAAFRLGPEGAPPDEELAVWDTMYTTGSTGAPTPFVSTGYDFPNILAVQHAMMRLRGVTPDDSVLNLFPLTRVPHGAFARALHACAAVAIPVTAALPGHPSERRPELGQRLDEVVATAARVRPTILWGVPSYMRKVLLRAEELGVRLPSVRLVFVTGEGFGEEARQAMIAQLRRLGAADPKVSVSYGATEMQGGMVECTAGAGYHNPAPDQFLFEAVDPETHAPVRDGDEGLLLLTHLDRRGTVLLRYSLGDVARLTRARCPHCGALTERLLNVPHRVDGLVKIRGMLVDPLVLVDAVMTEPGVGDFQALVDKDDPTDALSMDRLRIKVVAGDGADDLPARLAARVRRAVGVTPVVELTGPDDPVFAARGWKAKPLLDLRAAAR